MTATAIERLAADGPYEPDARELMAFGRLVGAWDVDWTRFGDDGQPAERRRGEWHFAWILGGRGVQDVIWTVGGPPHDDGTTVRCWDREHGVWRSAFLSPGDGEYVSLTGRVEGEDRIVQEVHGRPARWTFSEIAETSFLWRAERTDDGGRTWQLTHEMRATRR
jgi:hypothetical protein